MQCRSKPFNANYLPVNTKVDVRQNVMAALFRTVEVNGYWGSFDCDTKAP